MEADMMVVSEPNKYLEVGFSNDPNLYLRYSAGMSMAGMPYYGIIWHIMDEGDWIRLPQSESDEMEDQYQQCLKQL